MDRGRLVFLPFGGRSLLFFAGAAVVLPYAVLTAGSALGFDAWTTLLLFLAILAGSALNLPLREVETLRLVEPPFPMLFFRLPPRYERVRTVVAVNVGGALLPAGIAAHFLGHMPPTQLLVTVLATGVVTAVTYRATRPVPGLGFALPPLLPPLAAVSAALLLSVALGAPLEGIAKVAFAAGVLGVVLGADVLHLRDVGALGAAVVSIGGAGTFDGIFLTGVFAALFAALVT